VLRASEPPGAGLSGSDSAHASLRYAAMLSLERHAGLYREDDARGPETFHASHLRPPHASRIGTTGNDLRRTAFEQRERDLILRRLSLNDRS
jgi:hypothetical protein